MQGLLTKTAGYVAGGILGLLVLIFGFLFYNSPYYIDGTATVNGVAAIGGEVILVNSNSWARLAELEDARRTGGVQMRKEAYDRLKADFLGKAQTAFKAYNEAKEKGALDDGANALASPPSKKEREEVLRRINEYLENARYCRQRGGETTAGPVMYYKGAEFWERKAAILKEKGRLVYDEAEWNYESADESTGIGSIKLQSVSKVRRTEPGTLAALEIKDAPVKDGEKPGDAKEVPIVPKAFVAANYLDTNAVMKAAKEVCDRLKADLKDNAEQEEDFLAQGQMERVMTDESGRFTFKGGYLCPGQYGIVLNHSMLTDSGDVLPVRWLVPVKVEKRLFSLHKVTKVALDDTNREAETVAAAATPDSLKTYAGFLEDLKKEAAKIK